MACDQSLHNFLRIISGIGDGSPEIAKKVAGKFCNSRGEKIISVLAKNKME